MAFRSRGRRAGLRFAPSEESSSALPVMRFLQRKISALALFLCLMALGVSTPRLVGAVAGKVDFNRDIQPILSENCYHCHGPDEKGRKAKLRLDRKEGAHGKNEDGVAIVMPGKVAESELITRILSTDPDEVMPTPKSNRKLTDAQKESLKQWVEQGAPWAEHWAFIAPVRPPLAEIRNPKSEIPSTASSVRSWSRRGFGFRHRLRRRKSSAG